MSYSLNAAGPGSTPPAADFGFVDEDLLGHLERGGVAMLFVLHHARHALDALHHLRIAGLHQLRDEPGQLVEIRILAADHAGIAHGAAHDLAQHVAAAFVRRQHAIVNQKRGGARMIGIDAQRGIGALRRRRTRRRTARRRGR